MDIGTYVITYKYLGGEWMGYKEIIYSFGPFYIVSQSGCTNIYKSSVSASQSFHIFDQSQYCQLKKK